MLVYDTGLKICYLISTAPVLEPNKEKVNH